MSAIRGTRPTRLFFCVILIVTLGSVGCSKFGTVSGTVKYKGNLLKGGNVIFYSGSQNPVTAPISPEGTYTASKVPVGEATVCVETESAKPNANAGRSKPPASSARGGAEQGSDYTPPGASADRYVKIEMKYADKDKSGVTYTVKPGSQPYDIELP